MNRASKAATPSKALKAAQKARKSQQPKRALKTKKNVKKTTKVAPPAPMTSSMTTKSALSPFMMARRKMANIKDPMDMNNTESKKYDQMLPSSTLASRWDEELDEEPSEMTGSSADESVSTEVEDHLVEHGDTLLTMRQPAQVQYNIFTEDPQFEVSKRLIGPPGTIEEPTMVFSPKPYRIVGCVGTLENPHQLGWFSMEGYLKHMCPSCGQIFQLTNNPDDCDFSYVEKVDNMKHFVGH